MYPGVSRNSCAGDHAKVGTAAKCLDSSGRTRDVDLSAMRVTFSFMLQPGADSGYFLTVANEKAGGFPRKKLS